ncbi:MAG: hypothetical protein ABI904_10685 [Chloroflexota bacterium]
MFTGTLERAILETLAYSDIFEYPLRLEELHRYLPIVADIEQVSQALSLLTERVGKQDGFYFLSEHENVVQIRRQREAYSQKLLQRALKYGRMLGALPFIRMVALTGSLAVMNSAKGADFDYMLVTAPNRVWTARAFALLFNRVTRLLGHILCPNLIVAETALAWTRHDLYSARELCQMIPITGVDVYQRLMKSNEWVKEFLPNVPLEYDGLPSHMREQAPALQNVLELPLRGKLGGKFEAWEMNRKIARFSKQAGFGEETVFNAEICQGNFDHHRSKTKEMLEDKLSALEKEVTVTFKVTVT